MMFTVEDTGTGGVDITTKGADVTVRVAADVAQAEVSLLRGGWINFTSDDLHHQKKLAAVLREAADLLEARDDER